MPPGWRTRSRPAAAARAPRCPAPPSTCARAEARPCWTLRGVLYSVRAQVWALFGCCTHTFGQTPSVYRVEYASSLAGQVRVELLCAVLPPLGKDATWVHACELPADVVQRTAAVRRRGCSQEGAQLLSGSADCTLAVWNTRDAVAGEAGPGDGADDDKEGGRFMVSRFHSKHTAFVAARYTRTNLIMSAGAYSPPR